MEKVPSPTYKNQNVVFPIEVSDANKHKEKEREALEKEKKAKNIKKSQLISAIDNKRLEAIDKKKKDIKNTTLISENINITAKGYHKN